MVDTNTQSPRKNSRVAMACVLFVGVMIGAAYAAVPLYDLFCRVTGYGGTTQVAESDSDVVLDRTVTVRFDANVARGLNWEFRPETTAVTLKMGETMVVNYIATNLSDRPLTGTSTFNVTPGQAGAYFNKLQCFCFIEQELQPGESIEMPVQFFVSPDADADDMMDGVATITLSYTFFPVADAEQPVAAAVGPDRENETGSDRL